MVFRFDPISFGDSKPSHYEQQMQWEVNLSGPTTPGGKVMMFLRGQLEQSREKGQEFSQELKDAVKDHKWKPTFQPAPELTPAQKEAIERSKAEREEYRRMWDMGLIERKH